MRVWHPRLAGVSKVSGLIIPVSILCCKLAARVASHDSQRYQDLVYIVCKDDNLRFLLVLANRKTQCSHDMLIVKGNKDDSRYE